MTLSAIRDRIEQYLFDTTNARWSTAALDESLRQALAMLNTQIPYRAILTLALTASGREIDISSLTYVQVERVWWDYDDSDPTYPPNFREFELWPGNILFINDPDEPASGDTVRLWVKQNHTLNGLDGATTETLTDERALSALVVGAAGKAALSRAISLTEQVNIDGWTHKRLKEWGGVQLQDFGRQLLKLSGEAAARAAGLATMQPLDRWDIEGGW